jgi:hypothetical protein
MADRVSSGRKADPENKRARTHPPVPHDDGPREEPPRARARVWTSDELAEAKRLRCEQDRKAAEGARRFLKASWQKSKSVSESASDDHRPKDEHGQPLKPVENTEGESTSSEEADDALFSELIEQIATLPLDHQEASFRKREELVVRLMNHIGEEVIHAAREPALGQDHAAVRKTKLLATVVFHLGQALYRAGQFAEATIEYQRAIMIYPAILNKINVVGHIYLATHREIEIEGEPSKKKYDLYTATLYTDRFMGGRSNGIATLVELLDDGVREVILDYAAAKGLTGRLIDAGEVSPRAAKARRPKQESSKDDLKRKNAARETTTPQDRPLTALQVAEAKDRARLDVLKLRFRHRLETIDLPKDGFKTKEQAADAARLAKTLSDMQELQAKLGLEVTEKPERVREAERMRGAFLYVPRPKKPTARQNRLARQKSSRALQHGPR